MENSVAAVVDSIEWKKSTSCRNVSDGARNTEYADQNTLCVEPRQILEVLPFSVRKDDDFQYYTSTVKPDVIDWNASDEHVDTDNSDIETVTSSDESDMSDHVRSADRFPIPTESMIAALGTIPVNVIPADFRKDMSVRDDFIRKCTFSNDNVVYANVNISTAELLSCFPADDSLANMFERGVYETAKFLTHKRTYGPLLELHIAVALSCVELANDHKPEPLAMIEHAPQLIGTLSTKRYRDLVHIAHRDNYIIPKLRKRHFSHTIFSRCNDNAKHNTIAFKHDHLTLAMLIVDCYVFQGLLLDALIFIAALDQTWLYAYIYHRCHNLPSRQEIDTHMQNNLIPEYCCTNLMKYGMY